MINPRLTWLSIYIYIIIPFKGTTTRFILSWASTGFNILGKFNNQNGHQHRENGVRGNHAEANLDKPSWAATTGTARSAYPICHWHNCLQKLRVCSYQTWLSEVDSFQRGAEAISTWYMAYGHPPHASPWMGWWPFPNVENYIHVLTMARVAFLPFWMAPIHSPGAKSACASKSRSMTSNRTIRNNVGAAKIGKLFTVVFSNTVLLFLWFRCIYTYMGL